MRRFTTLEEIAAAIRANPNAWLIEAERHVVATQGLRGLIRAGWPILEGASKPFIHSWHIDAICEHLTAVSTGQIRRLAISMPPRHMKSLSVAVSWLAWDWIAYP